MGSLTDETVKVCKIIDQQSQRPVIHCEGAPLDNVFRSKYLNTIFTADTQQKHDVKERIARALTRCGQLRHILDSPDLSATCDQAETLSSGGLLHPNLRMWVLVAKPRCS